MSRSLKVSSKKLLNQNVLENKPSCKPSSFCYVAIKNSEDGMNPEVISSQTLIPQMQNLCNTPQIRNEVNSTEKTDTKHNKITLTNLTIEFVALKTFMIDELHSVNKNINLIKNNTNNNQILDEVKHLRDNNNTSLQLLKNHYYQTLNRKHFRHHKLLATN